MRKSAYLLAKLFRSVLLLTLLPISIWKCNAQTAGNNILALKTNLLYDAVGAINIGIELPLKKNFSWEAGIAYSYWRTSNNLYALQTLEYETVIKYWPHIIRREETNNPDYANKLNGLNIGVYSHYWQRFDVQWKNGYQGNGAWSAGLVCGYAFPISSRFSMECSIEGGWLSIPKYRHYLRPQYGQDGKPHLIWKETGKWNGLSLTKINVSLVWHIQLPSKKSVSQ